VSRSPSSSQAKTAAKNGALFSRTEAIAAPARRVPSAMPARVRTTFPTEIAAAQTQPRTRRGSDEPTRRSTGNIRSPPTSAREVVITEALVK